MSKNSALADSLEGNRRRFSLLYASIKAIPDSRVSVCKHVPALNPETMGLQSVKIAANGDGETSFTGAAVCGSVWLCPVCNPRIAKQRQGEILHAQREHRKNGGVTLLLTITFSHSRNDNLKETLSKFSKALSRMKACRKYKSLKQAVGYVGSIRALEFTHSDRNGWHPHTHEIVFLDKTITEAQAENFRQSIFNLWEFYAVKHGLGKPTNEHGINVKYATDNEKNDGMLASYVAGMDYELTHLHTKESKEKGVYSGRSPWQILKDIADKKSERDIFLWREYAHAVHGRNQLFWSKGLKDRFQVKEFSDLEAAAVFEEKKILRVLSDDEFYLICYAKKHAEALEVARLAPMFLDVWFAKLKYKYRERLRKRREDKNDLAEWVRLNCDSAAQSKIEVARFAGVTENHFRRKVV